MESPVEDIPAIKQHILDTRLSVWLTILENLDARAQTTHSVVYFPNSSTYIFSTGPDVFWMVDPAFCRDGERPGDTRKIADAIRRKISFIVISHLHADHCQPELASLLADSGIQWIIPKNCMEAFVRKTRIPTREITLLEDDQHLHTHGISITARHGFHKDPVHCCDIPAAAYDIALPDGITLFLPGDIRDFQAPLACTSPVDYLFAHVFLGRDDATGTHFPLLDDYCRFIAMRKSRQVILAHLYEIGRAPKDLWTHRHANMVKSRLAELAPDTPVVAPHFGDSIILA